MPNTGYFDKVFAENGQVVAVPDDAQGDGSVSMDQGYGPLYSTPVDSGGLNFPRGQHNQLLNYITVAIQKYQQECVPPFISTAMNNGSAYEYKAYALVRYDDGGGEKVYQSLNDANDTLPTDTDHWAQVPLGNAASSVFTGGTTGGAANVQTVVTTPAGFDFSNGQIISAIAGFSNSSSATLNPDTLGAKVIKKASGAGLANLTGGEIVAGNAILLMYNLSLDVFILLAGIPALQPSKNLSDLGTLATALANLGFASGSGYFKVPNAVDPTKPWIIQWGDPVSSNAGYITTSFPIAFPNALGRVVACTANSTNQGYAVEINTENTTGFRFAAFIGAGTSLANNLSCPYIAIGN